MTGLEFLAGAVVGSLLAAAPRLDGARRRGRMASHPVPTFLFADLVGYTRLTESVGDAEATRVAQEFARALSRLSREHGARQIKSMGDGAMVWAPDATNAMAIAACVLRELGARPDLLPVRVGAHTGPAVMRGGDWYGHTVNVAARLARQAKPGEALISGATRSAARGDIRWLLKAHADVGLRGVKHPVPVWRLLPWEMPIGIPASRPLPRTGVTVTAPAAAVEAGQRRTGDRPQLRLVHSAPTDRAVRRRTWPRRTASSGSADVPS